MAKFNPLFYREFRPFYPVEVFAGLREVLLKRGFLEPFQVADLGCGIGHSSVSLLRAGVLADVQGIDPDSAMLTEAQSMTAQLGLQNITFQVGSGEETGLPKQSVDAVLMGSSFHWMHPRKTRDEVLRILKPSGLVWIFEYQFPKAPHLPTLNEWIRRQFNHHWRAPHQVPRGNFAEVTRVFRIDPGWETIADLRPPMELLLNPAELAGMLFSQSRVLHYEATLSEVEKQTFRVQTQQELAKYMQNGAHLFDFNLQLFGCCRKS